MQVENECNCKAKNKCPMNGLCNWENLVYQEIISPKQKTLKVQKLI